MDDADIVELCMNGKLAAHNLERTLGDFSRAVSVRRQLLERNGSLHDEDALDNLPHKHFDYSTVFGACAENVVG